MARGPASRICAIRVSMPSAVMTMVSAKVSSVFSILFAVSGNACSKLTTTIARKPSANHGTAILPLPAFDASPFAPARRANPEADDEQHRHKQHHARHLDDGRNASLPGSRCSPRRALARPRESFRREKQWKVRALTGRLGSAIDYLGHYGSRQNIWWEPNYLHSPLPGERPR